MVDFYDTGYKSSFHGMTNVSIPEVNMLKNSSTLAVSVIINISIKLGSVSVNGPRNTRYVGFVVSTELINEFIYW